MGKLDALWEYQVAELQKEQLERDIVNTPSRAKFNKLHVYLTEQQSSISRMQDEMEQRQAIMDKMAERMDKLERDIELERSEFEGMLQDEECTAAEITECRENYEKLMKELVSLQKELSAVMGWMEKMLQDYKTTRATAAKAKKEYDALRLVCEQEVQSSEGVRSEALKLLQEKAKNVEGPLLERYKRVKQNHSIPMAKVENKQCGGCNMSLPMVVIKRVQDSDAIVECDNCGRILYAPDEV